MRNFINTGMESYQSYQGVKLIKINYSLNEFCNINNIYLISFTNKKIKEIADIIANGVDFGEYVNYLRKISYTGKPDFFAYSKNGWVFIEFKTVGDNIRNSQLNWIKDNKVTPCVILKSLTSHNAKNNNQISREINKRVSDNGTESESFKEVNKHENKGKGTNKGRRNG